MAKKRVTGDLYRTVKVPMPRLGEAEFARLIILRQHAGWIWDGLVTLHRYIRHERRPWPTMQDLARDMTGQTAALGLMLGTQSQNLLFDEFLGVVKTAQENRKAGKAAGGLASAHFPWRCRQARDCHWDRRDVRATPSGLLFSLAKVPEPLNKSGLKRQEPLLIPYKKGIPRNCTAITIHYDVRDACFFLLFKIKVTSVALPTSQTTTMGIDLGQIRLAACMTSDGSSLNIKGRGLRSIQQGHNKKKAFRSARVARKVRGSKRRGKEISRRRRESRKVRDQVTNLLHSASRAIVNFAAQESVATIIIGDVVGVRDRDAGKRQNQANSDWPVAALQHMVTYKAEELGIKTRLVGEEYTTRSCPRCREVKRSGVSGRTFECSACGLQGHRDAVGAWNILLKWHVSADGHGPQFRDEYVAQTRQKYHVPCGVRGVRHGPNPQSLAQVICSAAQSRSRPTREARSSSAGRGPSPERGCSVRQSIG